MPTLISYLTRSKWCAIAATAITLLALIPQLHFWISRGSQWHGAYTVLEPDELLYSAYVNALIDGRPRRSDPVSGCDDHPQAPLPESLFSIQFVPPFAIAFLARAVGSSASTSFIALRAVSGLLTSLAVFWLLYLVLGDNKVASLGVLVVLCFGALAGGQGLIGLMFNPDTKFLGLPFLRGYEPSAPMPLFFVFCGLIWQGLTVESRRVRTIASLLGGLVLALLIFSYFYLWTAALAWFVCVGCLWSIMRANGKRRLIWITLVVGALGGLALWPYAHLLAKLPAAATKAQVLTFTHSPDLLRIPEILGAGVLIALAVSIRKKKMSWNEDRVIFAFSFALLPFLIFNQQIVTGRSIQPFHYEVFIANYAVLIGLVIVVGVFQAKLTRSFSVLLITFCLIWGLVEISLAIHARSDLNARFDEMVPLLRDLEAQATVDGTWNGLRNDGKVPGLVFSPELRLSGLLPTWAPQGSLLATGSGSFQTVNAAQSKQRLYTHFYYSNKSAEYLRQLLNDQTDDHFAAYYAKSVIFGPERVVAFLGEHIQPIGNIEIEQEVDAYGSFAKSFSQEKVTVHPLNYAVVPANAYFDFSNIDRWYERDLGERVGAYYLYRLKQR